MPEKIIDLTIEIDYNPSKSKYVKINDELFTKEEAFDFALMLLQASNEILDGLGREITNNLKGK